MTASRTPRSSGTASGGSSPPGRPDGETWKQRRARAREQARRTYFHGVEAVVAEAARAAGGLTVVVEPGEDHPRYVLRLTRPGDDHAAARQARISTWGSGLFFLGLSGGFEHLEIEYDDEPEALRLLVALAAEHLHGRSREVEEVLPSGTRQRCLEMTLDGEVHRVPEEQEAVFDSWQAALLGLPRLVVVHLVRRACRRSR